MTYVHSVRAFHPSATMIGPAENFWTKDDYLESVRTSAWIPGLESSWNSHGNIFINSVGQRTCGLCFKLLHSILKPHAKYTQHFPRPWHLIPLQHQAEAWGPESHLNQVYVHLRLFRFGPQVRLLSIWRLQDKRDISHPSLPTHHHSIL